MTRRQRNAITGLHVVLFAAFAGLGLLAVAVALTRLVLWLRG